MIDTLNSPEETIHLELTEKEGWKIKKNNPKYRTDARYIVSVENYDFPLCHPYRIHITLYRRLGDYESKYQHLKAAHDYLWPEYALTWNYWEERRFRAHCSDKRIICMASGASCGKSSTAARLGLLFYLSNPYKNTCIVASTTLDSLETRIWGYVQSFYHNSTIPLPVKLFGSKPPKILPLDRTDKIHGMFAIAIPRGEQQKVISTLIGRHPKKGFMVFLDESTEMDPSIMTAIPNLEKGVPFFQLWPIGNSNNKNDLHGALSTPNIGWSKINPEIHHTWETTHKGGICLYFNPNNSPAIHEKDPTKKALLSTFLPTTEKIESDKSQYGENSESYWRFTLGFWKSETDNTVSTATFMKEHEVFSGAEWSGFYPIEIVAGMDPAYQFGGTGCILRFAYLGHLTNGLMALDFREEEMLYRINISPNSNKSAELQIAEQVIQALTKHNCPLHRLCIDATGAGKPLAELIRTVGNSLGSPMKVSFTGLSKTIQRKKDDQSIITGTPTDFWFKFRDFVQHNQIKGLDAITVAQLCSRLVVIDNKTGKQRLESKPEYSARMSAINPKLAHSPDEADAAVMTLFSAIYGLGLATGQQRSIGKLTGEGQLWKAKLDAYKSIQRGKTNTTNEYIRPTLMPSFSKSIEDYVTPRFVKN